MITDNFCFYLQNRLIQTSQRGGQWYSDTSPFSIPCPGLETALVKVLKDCRWRDIIESLKKSLMLLYPTQFVSPKARPNRIKNGGFHHFWSKNIWANDIFPTKCFFQLSSELAISSTSLLLYFACRPNVCRPNGFRSKAAEPKALSKFTHSFL